MNIIYIIPAYNEASILREQMLKFLDKKLNIKLTVFIVENGSNDSTYEVARLLETDYPNKFKAFSIDKAGIGYAYSKGMEEALKISHSDDWVCLSAADLPFAFSDLVQFEKFNVLGFDCIIGSKLHNESQISRSFYREIITKVLSYVRYIFLNMKVADCQGTIFLKCANLDQLLGKVKSRDFFYTTELVSILESNKYKIIEVPIIYDEEKRKRSSISLASGLKYLLKIINFSINTLTKRNYYQK